jgi:hypothetical protein
MKKLLVLFGISITLNANAYWIYTPIDWPNAGTVVSDSGRTDVFSDATLTFHEPMPLFGFVMTGYYNPDNPTGAGHMFFEFTYNDGIVSRGWSSHIHRDGKWRIAGGSPKEILVESIRFFPGWDSGPNAHFYDFDNVSILATYWFPDPPAPPVVPDTGSTALMLAGAIGCLGIGRRLALSREI